MHSSLLDKRNCARRLHNITSTMPADAAPQSMSGGNASASTSGHTHSHTGCSPEELYQHVVGRWPGPELGYPGDHSDGHGRGGDLDADASLPVDDADGRGADSAGAAARAKKRRKVQRRAKVSEIWFPRAEMAFCTCKCIGSRAYEYLPVWTFCG